MTYLLLIIGGVAGALLRFHGTRLIQARIANRFPFGTFAINISGSFAFGLLYGLVGAAPSSAGQAMLTLFGTGFCGAYTTFSSFGYETVQLWRTDHVRAAVMNMLSQPVLGLLGAWVGVTLGARFAF